MGVYGSFSTATTPEFRWFIPKITNPINPNDVWFEGGTVRYQYRVLTYSLGGRGLYHLYRSETVDFYTRGSVGFSFNKITELGDRPPIGCGEPSVTIPKPDISLGGHFGLLYYVNDNWGFYGELGYSNDGFLQAGASYRILKKQE